MSEPYIAFRFDPRGWIDVLDENGNVVGHIEFEPDNTFVTFVTEDGRKFNVMEEES